MLFFFSVCGCLQANASALSAVLNESLSVCCSIVFIAAAGAALIQFATVALLGGAENGR